MNKKKDYSKFYISMIFLSCILFISMHVYDEFELQKHLQKDLDFAKETAEFIVFEAEVIGYCANMSNLSSDELLGSFLEYKADELIKNTFNNGTGLPYKPKNVTMEYYDVLEVDDE